MTETAPRDKRQWVLSVLEQYEAPLMRFVARLLGDEDGARDVVQHAFLRLCEQSPDALHGRVAQWLFTVCRNRAVDVLRAQRRASLPGDGTLTGCVGKEPDPAVAVEQDDLCRRLNGLIDGLPPNQREAIGLWSEGFTYRQAAEMLGHSEGNVRVLVHRALKYLRQHPLAREWLGEPATIDRLAQRRSTSEIPS